MIRFGNKLELNFKVISHGDAFISFLKNDNTIRLHTYELWLHLDLSALSKKQVFILFSGTTKCFNNLN